MVAMSSFRPLSPDGTKLLQYDPKAAEWNGTIRCDLIDQAKLQVADTKKRGPVGPPFYF